MRNDLNSEVRKKSVTFSKTKVVTNKTFLALAGTFKTLGDYSRVRIVWALVQGETCPSDISEKVGLSPAAVSHHLKILKASNLVKVRREHRQIFYSLDDDHINELFEAGLEHVEELLS